MVVGVSCQVVFTDGAGERNVFEMKDDDILQWVVYDEDNKESYSQHDRGMSGFADAPPWGSDGTFHFLASRPYFV